MPVAMVCGPAHKTAGPALDLALDSPGRIPSGRLAKGVASAIGDLMKLEKQTETQLKLPRPSSIPAHGEVWTSSNSVDTCSRLEEPGGV